MFVFYPTKNGYRLLLDLKHWESFVVLSDDLCEAIASWTGPKFGEDKAISQFISKCKVEFHESPNKRSLYLEHPNGIDDVTYEFEDLNCIAIAISDALCELWRVGIERHAKDQLRLFRKI